MGTVPIMNYCSGDNSNDELSETTFDNLQDKWLVNLCIFGIVKDTKKSRRGFPFFISLILITITVISPYVTDGQMNLRLADYFV